MSVSAAPRSPPKIAAPAGSAPHGRIAVDSQPTLTATRYRKSSKHRQHRPRTTTIAKPLARSFYGPPRPTSSNPTRRPGPTAPSRLALPPELSNMCTATWHIHFAGAAAVPYISHPLHALPQQTPHQSSGAAPDDNTLSTDL
eukprot:jgi/Tetstr1/463207/TSEL_008139.t1